jgi:hypothetical protein
MGNSENGQSTHPTGLSSILASAHDGINRRSTIMAAKWQLGGAGPAILADLPKKQPGDRNSAAKKPQAGCRSAGRRSKLWEWQQVSTIMRLMESSGCGAKVVAANAGLSTGSVQCRR